MSEARKKDEIDDALKLIENLRASGSLNEDSWAKCIVSLAYEYILAGEEQLALVLITKIPADYYRLVQRQQMLDDKMYGDLVILLAYKLIQMGVVDGTEEVFIPTMAPAKA